MLFNTNDKGEWEWGTDLQVGVKIAVGNGDSLVNLSKYHGIPLEVLQKAFNSQVKHFAGEASASFADGTASLKVTTQVDNEHTHKAEPYNEAQPEAAAEQPKPKKAKGKKASK